MHPGPRADATHPARLLGRTPRRPALHAGSLNQPGPQWAMPFVRSGVHFVLDGVVLLARGPLPSPRPRGRRSGAGSRSSRKSKSAGSSPTNQNKTQKGTDYITFELVRPINRVTLFGVLPRDGRTRSNPLTSPDFTGPFITLWEIILRRGYWRERED